MFVCVQKTLEQSSFETLEALGSHIAHRIFSHYRRDGDGEAEGQDQRLDRDLLDGRDWQIHVRLEKPTAVTLADCPVVEIRAESDSS